MPKLEQPAPFEDVIVCTPTVAMRAPVFAQTLAAWHRFGVQPLVQMQPHDWPLSGESQRANADIAVQRAVEEYPDANYVLFAEDDLLLDPQLDIWMPALKALDLPVTLFLSGTHQHPRSYRRYAQNAVPLPERIVQIRHLDRWWGSQAVLIPRWLCLELIAWPSDWVCWDIHFQKFLLDREIPLFAPIPNLVQQIAIPSSNPTAQIAPHSATYGRRGDGSGISFALPRNFTPRGDWQPDPRVTR